MLRTYRTCNPTVRFSKYEFNNKLSGSVTLLRITSCVTWTQSVCMYVCMYVCMHIVVVNWFFIFLYRISYHIMYPKLYKHLIKFIKKIINIQI